MGLFGAEESIARGRKLAAMATSVSSPFDEQYDIYSPDEDGVYSIRVRNTGEWAAGRVIFGGQQPVNNNQEILRVILEAAKFAFGNDEPGLTRFGQDELAIAHAALVYTTCISEIEPL